MVIQKTVIKKYHNGRPTIGLLIDSVASVTGYQTQIWTGIADTTQRLDANLICITGGSLNFSPLDQFDIQRNTIYELFNSNIVNGLIVMGSVASFISNEEFQDFLKHFQPLPSVIIGTSIQGSHYLVVDNYNGFRKSIEHLIEVHHCCRIAFIKGPENITEANERYRAYRETLAEYDLALEHELIAPGNFLPSSGVAAINLFLDERKLKPGVDFDALVAVNDNMAISAMEALQARGFYIPKDVAVAGFDDLEWSKSVIPSLTTVKQPLYTLGEEAVGIVLKLLEGKEAPEKVMLSTELVVRQSCGCHYKDILKKTVVPVVLERRKTFEDILSLQRESILSEIEHALSVSDTKRQQVLKWSGKLLDAFSIDLKNSQKSNAFLSALDEFLRNVAAKGDNVVLWNNIISILYSRILPYLNDNQISAKAINFLQQAIMLIAEMRAQEDVYQKLQANYQTVILHDISQKLITTFDFKELIEVTARQLPRLGIERGYISLYEHCSESVREKPGFPAEWSRLVMAYDKNGIIRLEEGRRRFPTCRLVPEGVLASKNRYHLLVDLLYFRDEPFGIIVFEVGPLDGAIYLILRTQISSALKGAFLFRDHKLAEKELRSSNRELEKFAHVASYDLQEPLKMVQSYLQLLEQRYKGKLDKDADEFIFFASDGAVRMQTLIQDLLKYSRVETRGKPFMPVDCKEVLKSVLSNLKVAIEESGTVVTWDDLPTVMGDTTQLTQLFQNLVSNAIKFHREGIPPKIHAGIKQQANAWVFSVSDNGIGICTKHFERIFKIFQRLHTREKYAGTGIGLAMCKKIVEHHGGRIWIDSELGRGSTFYFTIPVKEK
jgi:signal transduction histidine kinase/DNA-binding LacI/PurR family transcriptional regulator